METIPLKVVREPYVECGECMFLSTTQQQIRKHGITDVYCRLFNLTLSVQMKRTSTEQYYQVEPCSECSELEN